MVVSFSSPQQDVKRLHISLRGLGKGITIVVPNFIESITIVRLGLWTAYKSFHKNTV